MRTEFHVNMKFRNQTILPGASLCKSSSTVNSIISGSVSGLDVFSSVILSVFVSVVFVVSNDFIFDASEVSFVSSVLPNVVRVFFDVSGIRPSLFDSGVFSDLLSGLLVSWVVCISVSSSSFNSPSFVLLVL